MTLPQIPQEHLEFNSLVAEIDDYEPLPEINTRPDVAPLLGDEAQTESIDAEILAGLVTP